MASEEEAFATRRCAEIARELLGDAAGEAQVRTPQATVTPSPRPVA